MFLRPRVERHHECFNEAATLSQRGTSGTSARDKPPASSLPNSFTAMNSPPRDSSMAGRFSWCWRALGSYSKFGRVYEYN